MIIFSIEKSHTEEDAEDISISTLSLEEIEALVYRPEPIFPTVPPRAERYPHSEPMELVGECSWRDYGLEPVRDFEGNEYRYDVHLMTYVRVKNPLRRGSKLSNRFKKFLKPKEEEGEEDKTKGGYNYVS